jgi:hypothetical protein
VVDAGLPRQPAPHAPRYVAGALVAFLGVSAANVLPPPAQVVLYLMGLASITRRSRHLIGREVLALLLACAAVLADRLILGIELDGAFRVVRPVIEGVLLAHVLYHWCYIGDFKAAAVVLAGMVAIQFFAGALMAADGAGRVALLESIYADESYQNSSFVGALLFRGYGYSRHHLFGLALALGLSSALLLARASIEHDRGVRAIFGGLSVAGFLLATINARIGLLPIVTTYALGMTLLFNSFYPKHLLAAGAALTIPLLYLGAWILGDNFETIVAWLGEGVAQLGSADSADSNTLSDLSDMLVFAPDVVQLVVGSGRACDVGASCYSDIGFIRALQEGGLVFLLLVGYLYVRFNEHAIRLFRRSIDTRQRSQRRAAVLVAVVMHSTFLLAMIKGEAFAANDYSRLVVALGCLGMLAGLARRPRSIVGPAGRIVTLDTRPATAG